MSVLIPSKEDILNNLLRALVEGRNLEEIAQTLFKELGSVIPLDRLGIVFISSDQKFFESKVNVAEYPLKLNNGFQSKIQNSTLKEIIETSSSRIINDMPAYLEKKPESISTRLMVMEGIKSNLSVPLSANGKPIGVMFLASKDLGAYGQGHIDIVSHFVLAISITLEKALLLENLRTNQKNLIEIIAEKEGLEFRLQKEVHAQFPWDRSWKEWEEHILVNILKKCRGKIYGKTGAAQILDIPPTTLQGKLKKLGLSRKSILTKTHI